MNQGKGKVIEMRRPVQRVRACEGLREGSTGQPLRVVAMPGRLQRVWAVGEAVLEVMPAAISESRRGAGDVAAAPAAGRIDGELAFYRKYTEALLRRYMRLSMSAGRVPSLMGRELFRGHVSHYKAHTFEDVAIFCFDVERQIARLTPGEKELVKRISLQQYSQMEVSGMLGVTLRQCVRRYAATLDRLTELFLTAKLLEPQKLSRG